MSYLNLVLNKINNIQVITVINPTVFFTFIGFKLSVHHHLDQPIMSIKEIDISVGSESQVAVATTLTTTTPDAQNRFNPEQRGCYFEGELFLKYLPKLFYR